LRFGKYLFVNSSMKGALTMSAGNTLHKNSAISRRSGTRRLYVCFILPLIVPFLTNGASADIYTDLAPGHWIVVSNNTVEDVQPCPSSNCSYSAVSGVAAVMDDWGGGALMGQHGAVGGLAVFGGGHDGYFGSEVYVFDLDKRLWERLSDPYDDGSSSVASDCNNNGVYPDGSACPPHTYDRLSYHPYSNSMVLLGGTTDPTCGGCGSGRAHIFDLDAKQWQLGAAHPSSDTWSGSSSAYDPNRDVFWMMPTFDERFTRYSIVDNAWTEYGNPFYVEIDAVAAIDPIRDIYVFVEGYSTKQVYAIDLKDPGGGAIPLNTVGDTEIQDYTSQGFVWDSVTEMFVAWNDGADVYTLAPPAGSWESGDWRWTRIPPAPTNAVVPSSNPQGTYGRFRHIPAVNAFVLVSFTDGPVYAYKLNDAPGAGTNLPNVPGTPRPDDSSPKSTAASVYWIAFLLSVFGLRHKLEPNRRVHDGLRRDAG
jgi:hypothetical protein